MTEMQDAFRTAVKTVLQTSIEVVGHTSDDEASLKKWYDIHIEQNHKQVWAVFIHMATRSSKSIETSVKKCIQHLGQSPLHFLTHFVNGYNADLYSLDFVSTFLEGLDYLWFSSPGLEEQQITTDIERCMRTLKNSILSVEENKVVSNKLTELTIFFMVCDISHRDEKPHNDYDFVVSYAMRLLYDVVSHKLILVTKLLNQDTQLRRLLGHYIKARIREDRYETLVKKEYYSGMESLMFFFLDFIHSSDNQVVLYTETSLGNVIEYFSSEDWSKDGDKRTRDWFIEEFKKNGWKRKEQSETRKLKTGGNWFSPDENDIIHLIQDGLKPLYKNRKKKNDQGKGKHIYRQAKLCVLKNIRNYVENMLTIRESNGSDVSVRHVILHNNAAHNFTLKTWQQLMPEIDDFVVSGENEKMFKEIFLHKKFELHALYELHYALDKAVQLSNRIRDQIQKRSVNIDVIFDSCDKLIWIQQKLWHDQQDAYKTTFYNQDNLSNISGVPWVEQNVNLFNGSTFTIPNIPFCTNNDDVDPNNDDVDPNNTIFDNKDNNQVEELFNILLQINNNTGIQVNGGSSGHNDGMSDGQLAYELGTPNLEPLIKSERNQVNKLCEIVYQNITSALNIAAGKNNELVKKYILEPLNNVGQTFYRNIRNTTDYQTPFGNQRLSGAFTGASADASQGLNPYTAKSPIKSIIQLLLWSLFELDIVVLYFLKILRLGTLCLSIYASQKIFVEKYMKTVYTNKRPPPHLFRVLLLAMSIDAFMQLVITMGIIVSSIMLKKKKDTFVLDDGFIFLSLKEYIMSSVLLLLIGLLISHVMITKRYFNYRNDGIRVIKGFSDIMTGVFFAATIIPCCKLTLS